MTGFLGRGWLVAGALPWLVAFPLYRLWVLLFAEVGLLRAVGTLGTLALGLLALAALLAGLTRAWRPGPRMASALRIGLFALVVVQLAAIGLVIYFFSPRLAPPLWQVLAALGAGVALLGYARQPAHHQARTARGLLRLGLLAYAVPLLASPLIIYEASAERQLPALNAPPPTAPALRPDAPRRVVLVTIDALRRQSTSLASPGSGQTPHLARLAARSHEFTQARAITDATLLSLPALLTGAGLESLRVAPARTALSYLPSNHTGFIRDGALTGLAGYLAPGGYPSYYATMLLTPRLFGLEQEFKAGFVTGYGFDSVNNRFNTRAYLPLAEVFNWIGTWASRAGPEFPGYHPGALTESIDAAIASYQAPDAHNFVWLHMGVPHEPLYEVDNQGPGGRLRLVPGTEVPFHKLAQADAATLARYERMYEADVRYADQELGRFLAALETTPLWADTLLVLTADHGTAFVLGQPPHGTGAMTENLTHVPLLVHRPGQQLGERHTHLVAFDDLVPSVLDLVYRQPVAGLPGRVLWAPPDPDRIVTSWGLYRDYAGASGHPRAIAAYQRHFKYMRRFPGGQEALYDLSSDPAGTRDVSARYPGHVSTLRRAVEERHHPPVR